MSDTPTVPGMRPEPPRGQYGHYLLPDPARPTIVRDWTRATTVAKTISDEYHLTQWKRRMVAQGLARVPNLLDDVSQAAERLAAAGDDWRASKEPKRTLDELCDQAAAAAGANDGSALGIALHTLTEWHDAGRIDEVEVPEELADDLAAYVKVMDSAGIVRPVEYIERIVINTTLDTAGTFDRLVRLPDGRLVVADLKTQKTVDFGWLEIAIQLSEYAYADALVSEDFERLLPMPAELDRDIALVIHLPVGKAEAKLYEIDLGAGWHCAQVAAEVRRLRSRSKAMGRPYVPSQRPAAQPVGDALMYNIQHAQHPDALTGLWRQSDQSLWTPAHIEAAKRRKAELTASA